MAVVLANRFRKWVNETTGQEGVTYWCAACEQCHGMTTKGPGAWDWNGDPVDCVFSPSQLTTWNSRDEAGNKIEHRCHTFIGMGGAPPGFVIFLDDCTHNVRGVHPIPNLPDWLLT